ncbi:MAG: hypothetical protein AB7I19_12865 [Planctomycetota bacterium]
MAAPFTEFLRIAREFDPTTASRKLALLRQLGRASLRGAAQVVDYHETLCFLRAYPDNAAVLAEVERQLAAFASRADLRRHASALRDTGIAGTAIQYSFFGRMARWLADRYPKHLRILWDEVRKPEQIEERLPLLTAFAESVSLDELVMSPREWIDLMRGKERDATWLIRRCAALGLPDGIAEKFYEDMDIEVEIEGLPGGPSRTMAKAPVERVVWQSGPMRHQRPDLREAAVLEPRAIRELDPAEGAAWIDRAREAMVTRSRDLDAFSYGDPSDVRVIEWEDGLSFIAIGVLPHRRLLLEAVYAYLTVKNGVPIGYVLNSALYGSADIAYNVFETWRGAEAAWIYSRVVATVRTMFGADSFTVYPYQLGDQNEEGLASGSWWFYQKLGYRPRDAAARTLMDRELARMRKQPGHRSSRSTLVQLARHNVFLHLGRERDDVIGLIGTAFVGLAISRELGRRFGADREGAEVACTAEFAALAEVEDFADWSVGEQQSFRRWAPLVAVLDAGSWGRDERIALGQIARSKGGRREQDFVARFDAHPRLRKAVLRIAAREEQRLD